MKDYGHGGRLKPEKKKKRKFEVIVNTATQGIYSDFTPMKVAKKVTSELVGKKKQIIFHLREKGKSGKTYGYIGNIRDGKVMVRIHKMSGGIGEPVFTNQEKPTLFSKNGVNPIKIIREDGKYFVCFFGVSDQSPNYKYFVYFSDITKSNGIKFYQIDQNTFSEIDVTKIENPLLIKLIQLLKSNKNTSTYSLKNIFIEMIIEKITKKLPNIKTIINEQKRLIELQSPNYINNTKSGCIFYSPGIEDFKASDTANISSIKRRKFCGTRQTLLFFTTNHFIEYNGNKYFRFVIFHEWNNVLLEELELKNNKLNKKKILIREIDVRTLERIKEEIERIRRANVKNNNFAQKILKSVDIELKEKQQQQPQQKLTSDQQITAQSLAIMPRIFTNPIKNHSVPSSTASTIPAQQPQQQRINQQNPIIQPYICPIDKSPIEEFKSSNSSEIFFGFDLDLLKIKPPTFYYKYSYRGNKFFYQLLISQNGTFNESKIDISVIPLYDLLCLYEFAKSKNNTELIGKIKLHILGIKNKTAPNSKGTIMSLKNSNFNVNIGTNIGKSKKKTEMMQGKLKTNYFFGKLGKKFKYVSFREGKDNDEIVYYYDQADLKNRKKLMDLQDRSALEDLVSFIILRRMKNPEDKEFGKGVYEKASQRIGQLKYQEIQKKINPNQSLQSPVQPQKSKQPMGRFLNFFNSVVSDKQPLPSNKNLQFQPQQSSIYAF